MKILVERDNFEEPKTGDIVQTNIGVCMKIYTGYVSLEGDNVGELNCDCDIKVSKVLIKSEDVVISKAEKEEIYEVEKPEETEDNIKTKYKDELFISEDFIKFIGKITGDNVKEIFKLGNSDTSFMKDCLNDLLFSIYKIYHRNRDEIDNEEFMVDELKDMIYDFFDYYNEMTKNLYDEREKRTDETLLNCIDYYKNVKKEDLLNVYCNISKMQYFGSLEEITYYFNKIGRLIEIGKAEYFHENNY